MRDGRRKGNEVSGIVGIILGVLALLMLGVLVLFSIHVIDEEIYGKDSNTATKGKKRRKNF